MAIRISDLDQISNGGIDLSQFLALDDPSQSFKITILQLADFMEARFLERHWPVGSTMYRVDNQTPTQLGFPGTWAKFAQGLSLATGLDNGTDVGTTTGSNAVAVPVPQHTHAASQESHAHDATQNPHGHTITVNSNGAHSHEVNARLRGDFVTDSITGSLGAAAAEHHIDSNVYPTTSSEGAHAHTATASTATPEITVTPEAPVITVENTGTAGVTMNVEGAHINGVLWKRTA